MPKIAATEAAPSAERSAILDSCGSLRAATKRLRRRCDSARSVLSPVLSLYSQSPRHHKMNPTHRMAPGAGRVSAFAPLPVLAVITALALSIACGSAQRDQGSGAGSAGTSESDRMADAGTSAAAGRDGGGSAGANAGAAGSGGASVGGGDARGGSAGASGAPVEATGGGKGGNGAGGSSVGGAGALQIPTCPATAPTAGSSCDSVGQDCFYEDCAGAGRTVATCQKLGIPKGKWSLQNTACGMVQCPNVPGAMSCASGQVCAVSEGGAIIATCAQSTCGAGPITCQCAHASCADCTISGTAQQGYTVSCNTCPGGGCP